MASYLKSHCWLLFQPVRILVSGLLLVCLTTGYSFSATHPDNSAIAETKIILDSIGSNQRIAKGVNHLIDPTSELTLGEVQNMPFSRFTGDTLLFGYSSDTIWLKIPIKNNLGKAFSIQNQVRFFVSIRYSLLDHVEIYHVRENGVEHFSSGDQYPFYDRFLKLNNFIFPLSLELNEESTIFIRVKSTSSIYIPLYIQPENAFIEAQHYEDATTGIYFGIALGLCIYNLFLWIGVRKKVYGFYVLSILNLMLFNATLAGYSFRLWPTLIEFQQVAIYLFSVTSGIAVYLFGIHFLETKKYQPKMHKVLLLNMVIDIICLPVLVLSSAVVAAKLNFILMFLGVSLLFAAAIRSMLLGFGPARYYLLGQGAVLFGVIFTALSSQGIIPFYYLAPSIMKWSSAFELIFFSIALADLLNNERKLREQAQRDAAKAQQKLLTEQLKLNEHLDTLVRQRTDELEQANKRLEELNTLDELTGLHNRRYLNQVLPLEYQRAFREKQPISVLMFDIDYFKNLNDTYGHQFGDLCLEKAGKIIKSNLKRPTDVSTRYGGEEFLVLLPATDIQGANEVAEKIRTCFEGTEVKDAQHSVAMTVSIGVAGRIPSERENYEDLLKEADDLLYLAKEAGRNRVRSA